MENTRLFYNDEENLKIYQVLSSDDFKELFMKMLTYKVGDEVKVTDFSSPSLYGLFMLYKTKIDFNEKKWENKAKASRENGKKGGRPKKETISNEGNTSDLIAFSEKGDKCDYKTFIKECRKERLNNRTYSELRFKDLLENNKISFQEEVIIDANCDKSYIVDFLVKGNIVVEIDGGYHSTEEQKEKDEIRDKNLKARGFNVIRIKNEELDNNEYIEDILKEIKHIRSKHPKLRIKKKNMVKTKEVKKPEKPTIFLKVKSAYDIP